MTVLGKGIVGKSTLTYNFLNYNTQSKYEPTIEDCYQTSIEIDGRKHLVEILDTAGQEDYQNMIDMWISFGDGFILVFAIDDKESFEAIKEKHSRVLKAKKKAPFILVGNKIDLENKRKVSKDEAQKLAENWGIEYIETSAKNNINCSEPFQRLAEIIWDGNHKEKGDCKCSIF
jgi:GTPase KRas protein